MSDSSATTAVAPCPAVNSCRKKMYGDASFIQAIRYHINELNNG